VSTDDDPQRTQEWNAPPEEGLEQPAAAEARQAELRAELTETDARRAEEEAGKAHEDVEAAERTEEKLSRKERKLRERAEEAEAAAAEARRRAEQASAATAPREPSLSGAHVTSPGLGADTDPAAAASAASGGSAAYAAGGAPGDHDRMAAAHSALERPEVQAGLAFAGAFVVARILKRIFD
jgi:hypothetical protein